jgi:hypothetical protein
MDNGEKKASGAGRGGNVPPPEHRFQPGHPGGPGRPPKGKLTRLMEEELEKIDPQGKSEALKLIQSIIKRAKAGNATLVKEVLERIEGKVTQPVEVEPLNVNVTYTTTTKKDES